MKSVALATEDELSEAVGQRLLFEACPALNTWPFLRKGGFGYLRSRMSSWCEMARQQPVLLLTDLDTAQCPVQLIDEWLGTFERPANLILRVVVREIEAWLLADHQAMRHLIGNRGRLPPNPDSLQDPKSHLLRLVDGYASRAVKDDLLAKDGAIARQGLGYNARLSELVQTTWDPERAALRSESLSRTRLRLREMADRVAS